MLSYSTNSLKQQSSGRHAVLHANKILILNRPDFVLTPQCCVLSGETPNTNFIGFGLIRPAIEPTPTIYSTLGGNTDHFPSYTKVVSLSEG